jgi:hypothetical protein
LSRRHRVRATRAHLDRVPAVISITPRVRVAGNDPVSDIRAADLSKRMGEPRDEAGVSIARADAIDGFAWSRATPRSVHECQLVTKRVEDLTSETHIVR